MAYSLYRSAAASPGAFGQGLAALQSAINFRDVKSDAGVKALQEVAINDFVAKANMAKQALGELGAFNRDELLVDYYKERDDKTIAENKKVGKINALLGLLSGSGVGPADLAVGGFDDPRNAMQRDRNYRSGGIHSEIERMSGLYPGTAINQIDKMFDKPQLVNDIQLPGQAVSSPKPGKLEEARSQRINERAQTLAPLLGFLQQQSK